MEEEEEICKLVLLGNAGVGKTSIIIQFLKKDFNPEQMSTTGATFSSKSVKVDKYNKDLSFEIWDTAGQEKYRSLTKMFYKDASVAILVYDITNIESFEDLKEYWVKEIKEHSPKDIILAIAANKSDLYENEKVTEDKGRDLATEIGAIFKTTSAKNEVGIEDLFKEIAQLYCKKQLGIEEPNAENQNNFKVDDNNNQQPENKTKKGCC